ncbi:hypothetical protein K435DRAFT_876853 [Dendrothele bispora CBS 962.96]|uniref:Nephrocystin 3-like N-terminal domain-containing protein n=1 Tax=Dendrothele bispora (strain CBS 962.96) TaxID=1314807 RepID=A0A4S8KR51_DENBC|nr:hypothetical protein K435DRAFT_876853 [Dendrothele bispora CBS 962.96]
MSNNSVASSSHSPQGQTNFFPNATGFHIQGGEWNFVADNIINNYISKSDNKLLLEKLNPILNPARKQVYCVENTRVQILHRLCQWAQAPGSGLAWISGMAGTGKSAIAVSLAHHLREMHSLIELVTTFHCVRGHDTSDVKRLIPTISYYLAQSQTFSFYANNLIEKFNNQPTLQPTISPLHLQFQDLLNSSVLEVERQLQSGNRPVIIIIDGLDEWGSSYDQGVLVKHLFKLVESMVWLKIIITGRPQVEEAIVNSVTDVRKFLAIDLKYDDNADADIGTLIRHRLEVMNVRWVTHQEKVP